MLLVSLLAAAATGAPEDPGRVVIDLTLPAPCPEAEQRIETDIVVCAKVTDQERHRLRPLDRNHERDGMPLAAVEVAPGTTLSAETESADLGMVRAQRALVRLKIKF